MAETAPARVDFARQNQLWEAIQQIPDGVLTDYLADNIIDEQEIEDITLRLEQHMTSLHVTPQDHSIIRDMVREAVAHIKAVGSEDCAIEGRLGATTLNDVRMAMGSLLAAGNISLAVIDTDLTGELSPNACIPDERPDDYDETAENPIE